LLVTPIPASPPTLIPAPRLPDSTFGFVEHTAIARDGPVRTASRATSEFDVVIGSSLLTYYSSQTGARTVRDEVPDGQGGTIVYQAGADSFAGGTLLIKETLEIEIPALAALSSLLYNCQFTCLVTGDRSVHSRLMLTPSRTTLRRCFLPCVLQRPSLCAGLCNATLRPCSSGRLLGANCLCAFQSVCIISIWWTPSRVPAL
jgi:hypothetical protein